jgi:hypothetical protein
MLARSASCSTSGCGSPRLQFSGRRTSRRGPVIAGSPSYSTGFAGDDAHVRFFALADILKVPVMAGSRGDPAGHPARQRAHAPSPARVRARRRDRYLPGSGSFQYAMGNGGPAWVCRGAVGRDDRALRDLRTGRRGPTRTALPHPAKIAFPSPPSEGDPIDTRENHEKIAPVELIVRAAGTGLALRR